MEDPLQLFQTLDVLEPLTLTFGVELEFVLRFNPKDYAEESDDGWSMPEERARERMRAVLEEELAACNNDEGFSPSVPGFEEWDLGRDSSIHVPELWERPDEERLDYSAIELRSPALPYTTASLSQVKEVFRLLFSTFDILVNESCGLHVHVGNELKGFPLQTLKNFCILTTTFERELESLHPPSRIDNKYSRSSGALFFGISPWDVGRIIESMQSVEDLVLSFQENDNRYAYNLLNIVSGRQQTIEFRQHEATFDVDAIVKWVQLACGLVEKAHYFATEDHLASEKLDRYLKDTYLVPHLSILHVLASLGMEQLADYYSKRGLYTYARPAWAWANPDQKDAMTPWTDPKDRDEPPKTLIASSSVMRLASPVCRVRFDSQSPSREAKESVEEVEVSDDDAD